MDRCNIPEDLGMNQAWTNQSDPHLQEQDDAVVDKSMEDDVSLATSPTTTMTSTSSSGLVEKCCFGNLASVRGNTHPPAAQEEKRSNARFQTRTRLKLSKSFGDIRSDARHIGMDDTPICTPTRSTRYKTTRKSSKSFSDIRSQFAIEGPMYSPPRSTSHRTTRRLNTKSFCDIRSEIRHHISTDGTVMRIASKAHVDPEFKLAARRSLSIPRNKNPQGMRGRRQSTHASASDLLGTIEKAPAVPRTRSMGALVWNRHSGEKYAAVLRRAEVRSAIDKVLAAPDDDHKGPTLSRSRRSDSNVRYNAQTPSFGSASRSAGQINRVSQLAMRVKSSHESFQKVMDESIESDFEVSERNIHHNAKFEYIQETPSIEQQLRKKDEQIKKLLRQLEDARALNQEKDLEIKRSKSAGSRSRMSSRRSSDPSVSVPLHQVADLHPASSSARRSCRKPRNQGSNERESSSVVRRRKKEKASKNVLKHEESSVSSSSREKGKENVETFVDTQKAKKIHIST
ncbi:MAG: hypothetical protein SGBAC_008349 [Bacillariaceae sp.]